MSSLHVNILRRRHTRQYIAGLSFCMSICPGSPVCTHSESGPLGSPEFAGVSSRMASRVCCPLSPIPSSTDLADVGLYRDSVPTHRLIFCLEGMLFQGCFRWWNALQPFTVFCKEDLKSRVHLCQCAGAVIHKIKKLLECGEGVIRYLPVNHKSSSCFRECLPGIPRFFSPFTERKRTPCHILQPC